MWRRRLREWVSWTLVLLVVVALALFAWASANPGHPAIATAAEWPGVGPWVESFRVRYGVSPAPGAAEVVGEVGSEPDRQVEVEWTYEAAPPEAGEAGSAVTGFADAQPGLAEAQDSGSAVWIAAGDPIRRRPDDDAPVVARADAFVLAEVVERREEWARVESTAGDGWVRAPELGETYPMGSGVVPPRPLAGAPAPQSQLRIAREMMGIEGAQGQLGPYPLYTDVDPARLSTLDRLARQIEPAYVARYGRSPRGDAREAVLIFAEREVYRLFQNREARIQGIPTGGYARHGMLALWVGNRRPDELASTLIHEVVHLLNRRSLGPALPAWLDEGMAYDLGASRVSPAGDLDAAELGGATIRKPGKIEYLGPVAGLRNLNSALARGDAPELQTVLDMDWEEFVADGKREIHYAFSGFFIRYLVSGEDGALRQDFQRFLDRVADGSAPTSDLLRQELGRTWEELDRGLGDFVRQNIRETTVRSRPRTDPRG